jgi:hypothetical protein
VGETTCTCEPPPTCAQPFEACIQSSDCCDNPGGAPLQCLEDGTTLPCAGGACSCRSVE